MMAELISKVTITDALKSAASENILRTHNFHGFILWALTTEDGFKATAVDLIVDVRGVAGKRELAILIIASTNEGSVRSAARRSRVGQSAC